MNVLNQYKDKTATDIKQIYEEKANDVAVGCINLSGDINIGMMMRTSSLFALNEFYIFGRRKYDKRSTVGTQHHIPNERIYVMNEHGILDNEKLKEIFIKLQDKYTIVFIEQYSQSIPLNKLADCRKEMKKPPIFIFGSESESISTELLKIENTICVEIPQKGVGRSFNVSNACAMVLWEWFRDL